MTIATVSEFKSNIGRIESWLKDGGQVEITRREPSAASQRRLRADFCQQLRKLWGDLPPLTVEQAKEMRDWEDGESEYVFAPSKG